MTYTQCQPCAHPKPASKGLRSERAPAAHPLCAPSTILSYAAVTAPARGYSMDGHSLTAIPTCTNLPGRECQEPATAAGGRRHQHRSPARCGGAATSPRRYPRPARCVTPGHGQTCCQCSIGPNAMRSAHSEHTPQSHAVAVRTRQTGEARPVHIYRKSPWKKTTNHCSF